MMKDRVAEFLSDLQDLTDKHGFVVGGCGCCGSPYLVKKGKKVAQDIEFGDGRYVIQTFCSTCEGYGELEVDGNFVPCESCEDWGYTTVEVSDDA
jgi:hypothetical protein